MSRRRVNSNYVWGILKEKMDDILLALECEERNRDS